MCWWLFAALNNQFVFSNMKQGTCSLCSALMLWFVTLSVHCSLLYIHSLFLSSSRNKPHVLLCWKGLTSVQSEDQSFHCFFFKTFLSLSTLLNACLPKDWFSGSFMLLKLIDPNNVLRSQDLLHYSDEKSALYVQELFHLFRWKPQ